LRQAEVKEFQAMLGDVVLLGICALLLVYLLATLLWPERF
jgi:K+-transporting ATPase KdpF subunit